MYLLNTALQKWEIWTNKNPELFKMKKCQKLDNTNKMEFVSNGTFRRISKKMSNLKKYYPTLYYSSNSILDEWGKNSFHTVNQKQLELDPQAPEIFWI